MSKKDDRPVDKKLLPCPNCGLKVIQGGNGKEHPCAYCGVGLR